MSMRICSSEFAVTALDSQFGMLVLANCPSVINAIRLFVKVFDCTFTASLFCIPSTIGVMNHHMNSFCHGLPPFPLRVSVIGHKPQIKDKDGIHHRQCLSVQGKEK